MDGAVISRKEGLEPADLTRSDELEDDDGKKDIVLNKCQSEHSYIPEIALVSPLGVSVAFCAALKADESRIYYSYRDGSLRVGDWIAEPNQYKYYYYQNGLH
ncbi:hypothetical protein GN958_ATG18938 [Phytophthora infestans]|uniref:Uncharacterized protein n=1 Tax=Phytophthora infestans TaxID=4787 RepID=A0A8S9TSS3_PHYIN|nr:hypothetical protein GN958_ATG18938 [Phytophthora infestans]